MSDHIDENEPDEFNALFFETERSLEFGPQTTMGEREFQAALMMFSEAAKDSLFRDGSVSPMLFFPTFSNGSIARVGAMPVGELLASPEGKEMLATLTNRLFDNPNHDMTILAYEAWTLMTVAEVPAGSAMPAGSELAAAQLASAGSIEDHPDRTEAVFLLLRSRECQAFAYLPIARDPAGNIISVGEGTLSFPEPGLMSGGLSRPSSRKLH